MLHVSWATRSLHSYSLLWHSLPTSPDRATLLLTGGLPELVKNWMTMWRRWVLSRGTAGAVPQRL